MKRIILSPGPVDIDISRFQNIVPMHHRSNSFRRIVIETEEMIRRCIVTSSPVYLITSSGTGAMEAAVANVTRPGERVLAVSGGKFGDRWAEICGAYGCDVDVLGLRPGEAVDIDMIVSKVRRYDPDHITLVHVESSTGLLFPLEELLAALPESRPCVIVDAISSVGAEDIKMDEWGMDVLVGAVQKAFAAPAGVSFVSLGKRGMERMMGCTRDLYYFSLKRYERGREHGETPFTPAVRSIQMVHQSLSRMEELGWEVLRERHKKSSNAYLSATAHLKLPSYSAVPSSAVQALLIPDELIDSDLVSRLDERGVIVAGGQGENAGKLIRTGFLGLYGIGVIKRIIEALSSIVIEAGFSIDTESIERELILIGGLEDILLF